MFILRSQLHALKKKKKIPCAKETKQATHHSRHSQHYRQYRIVQTRFALPTANATPWRRFVTSGLVHLIWLTMYTLKKLLMNEHHVEYCFFLFVGDFDMKSSYYFFGKWTHSHFGGVFHSCALFPLIILFQIFIPRLGSKLNCVCRKWQLKF